MNRDERKAAARQADLNASQSTAQLIFGFLQSEPTPRDAAATLAAVHAALIWTQLEQQDDRGVVARERSARKMAQEMVEGIMALWRANKALTRR
jgi:hypothetical protein